MSLKMEALRFSETLISTYKSTQRYNPDDDNSTVNFCPPNLIMTLISIFQRCSQVATHSLKNFEIICRVRISYHTGLFLASYFIEDFSVNVTVVYLVQFILT